MILWAALLIAGFILGPLNEARTGRIPLFNHIAMLFTLVVCALVWWWADARAMPLVGYTAWILLGMASGSLGDLIMSPLLPIPDRVIFGILAFGVGHIFYIAAYTRLSRVLGLANRQAQVVALATLLVIGFVVWWGLIRNPQTSTVLNYGSLGYALLIGAMVELAVALAAQEAGLVPLALGAALFMVSDAILGNHLLRGNTWFLVSDVVWITYIFGQALIVFSSAIGLRVYRPQGKDTAYCVPMMVFQLKLPTTGPRLQAQP